ncbi:MAG: phosphate acyltransferase PlsX [Oceanicaulis sp.]|uniref:phosphate acyltransferase PlsX n=1 Tax=Glycocaulis sp. TaxID=1969725 RepID=UPI0025C08502|nr:phosphate acyltransferase PlsX [Glycocaulis sp.]MCC5980725.1 phosphate acyltransferase PlsX [Oceanicaulis sp.]MCH8521088.1 phosphate acyltransferase PlsX [Glycocaulis sp.]
MTSPLVLSLDAMGGDHAPQAVVDGAALFFKGRKRQVRLLLHGDEAQLKPLVDAHKGLSALCEIRHTDSEVDMSAKPSEAVRRSRGSSMWNAVEAIRSGEAHVAVSAGNTGALMAISKVILRMKKGVHRPAIAASWPGPKGFTTVLDVGANVECPPAQLVEFAIMGEAFHRALHSVERPTVGLLNVGQEELKGNGVVRDADQLLRSAGLEMDYRGFVEGNDISLGTTDVVVTDGFTGNVALKTAEGTARLVAGWVREALTSSVIAKAGAALLQLGALDQLRAKMDPNSVNGGVFLGLNGIVVKSHGGTDAAGFATALRIALEMADSAFLNQIEHNLSLLAAAQEEDSETGQAALQQETA